MDRPLPDYHSLFIFLSEYPTESVATVDVFLDDTNTLQVVLVEEGTSKVRVLGVMEESIGNYREPLGEGNVRGREGTL